jgi:hypothetical protein
LDPEYYELDSPFTYYGMYHLGAEAIGQKLVWLPGEFSEIDRGSYLIQSPEDLDRKKPQR